MGGLVTLGRVTKSFWVIQQARRRPRMHHPLQLQHSAVVLVSPVKTFSRQFHSDKSELAIIHFSHCFLQKIYSLLFRGFKKP